MPLFQEHWEEIALDKDRIPLAVSDARYREMDAKGILHILTARDDGKLVGYYLAFVFPHVHYESSGLMSFTDVYYLRPEFRRGGIGITLFVEAERTLRERGVTKAYLSCKVHQDHSQLFELLGWRKTDYCFAKMLKD